MTFNTKSNTVGKGEKFGLCIKTPLADREVYASLTAPWVAMYRAQVKVNGEVKEIDMPDYSKPYLEQFRDVLLEAVAETSEEFMDRYFGGEEFSVDSFISVFL